MRLAKLKLVALALLGVAFLPSTTTVAELPGPAAAEHAIAASSPSIVTFHDCAGCPEMVVIPAGSFIMGSPADEPGFFMIEGPQRRVSIRQFAAGKFDVTRGEWAAFVLATKRFTPAGCAWSPSYKGEADASWQHLGFAQDATHPVVCVSWDDAQEYVRWLTQRTGRTYRLLTEAEWEYAARAGTTTPYPWGSAASHENANYGLDKCCGTGLASGRDRWVYTSPVGSFPPNAFGLYDMHGNVLQWVQDCFAPSYDGLPADGSAFETVLQLKLTGDLSEMSGTNSCAYRMLRGGDWGDPPAMIRSAFRNFGPPPGALVQGTGGAGFRVATDVTNPLRRAH
jgi:formylglycine-generating enzyme required for sulfatase activity